MWKWKKPQIFYAKPLNKCLRQNGFHLCLTYHNFLFECNSRDFLISFQKSAPKKEAKLKKRWKSTFSSVFRMHGYFFRFFGIELNICYLCTFHHYLLGHFQTKHLHPLESSYPLPTHWHVFACILLSTLFVRYSCDSLKVQNEK